MLLENQTLLMFYITMFSYEHTTEFSIKEKLQKCLCMLSIIVIY